MKKIIIILFITHCSVFTASAQWIAQNSGTNQNLYDIEFLNEKTGWAVGDAAVVIKTTNGGTSWFNVPNPSGQFGGLLWSVCPVDSEVVYVVAGYDFIMKTNNGGANWDILHGNISSLTNFAGVYFLNRDTGWFVGGNKVFRTYDGGTTMDSFYVPGLGNWDIYFKDIDTGLFSGTGRVYKSTNGGVNWFSTLVPTQGSFYEFHQLAVVNNNVWVAGSGDCPVFRSTDFCETWQVIDTINNYPPSVATCISFSSENTGWIRGSIGHLYKTTDGGFNWLREETGTDPRFWRSIYSFDDSLVWGVGGAGKMYYTTTGGQTLVNIAANEESTPKEFELYQNYPNPFNNETIIEFSIDQINHYKLEVFNILGERIKELFSEKFNNGKYKYKFNADGIASGIYIYKLSSNNIVNLKKFILLK